MANCLVRSANPHEIASKFSDKGIDLLELKHHSRNYKDLIQQVLDTACQNDINIIQTHGYKQSFVGIYLKIRYKYKWICFLHGTTTEDLKARLYYKLENLLQRFADRTVIVTRDQREKIFGGLDPHRVRILHNSVDPELPVFIQHGGRKTRRALGISDEFLFVVVGRLSPEKGVDLFIEAFALLLQQKPSARAVIVGDGAEKENLLTLCDKLGLNKYIKFAGYSQRVGDFMEAADAVVLPSRSEGSPNVILEAMAVGRPVVATDVGGVSEIIQPDISGILVEKESPAAICEGMTRIISDSALRTTIIANSSRRVRENFSPKKRSDILYSLYMELVENHDLE